MKSRLLVAAIAVPVLFVILFFLPPVVLAVVTAALCAVAAVEFLRAVCGALSAPVRYMTVAAAALMPLTRLTGNAGAPVLVGVAYLLALSGAAVIRYEKQKEVSVRNLLACMTALRFGIRKIVSRYSIEEYEGVFKYAGIESVTGYHQLIMNEVTRNLRTTEHCFVHVMEQPGSYCLAYKLEASSPLSNRFYGDVVVPQGVNIFAIIRDGTTIFPDLTTKFQKGDNVLLYTHKTDFIQLTNLLGKNVPEF